MFPQCFTRYDWCRSYLLPDHVATPNPRGGSVGMLGAHNAARGLLVEICRHTGAAPVALDYREAVLPEGDLVVEVTATARHPDGRLLVVVTATRARRRPPDWVGDWTLAIAAPPRPSRTGSGRRPRRCRVTWSPA